MFLSDLSVRRPVVAAVGAIMLTIIGIVGYLNLSVREYPETDPPVISVQTNYTGAAGAIMESRVTQPLEEALAGIEGIETITSTSSDGLSNISIEFRADRDVDSAANDVRDRVSGALDDLPEDILPPIIKKVDADAQAIVYLTVQAPGWDKMKLSDYVERYIKDRFSTIDGVAEIQLRGLARPSMRVWLDADRLAAFRLTPKDVETALKSQNVELPAGRIESASQNLTLRVNRGFRTPADFRTLVIGRGGDGYLVRLGDVARVEQGAENPYSSWRYNQQTGIGMGIIKQSGANTLSVAQASKKLAGEIQKELPPGVKILVGSDTSVFIEEAIKGVYHTLAEAAVLVVAVIFLFLGSWRATLIPAVTVPICLLATFAVLWACGFSINLMTLLALVLAIGLVVDDAIVVLENIHHRIVGGESPLVASFRGTRQVGFAVISTTLVVCAVFVPVMFIAGQTGLLFRELAVAMIASVAISGVLALSLAPMLCSKLLRNDEPSRLTAFIDRTFDRLERSYERTLERVLARPAPVLIAVCVFLVGAGWLFITVDTELVPPEDTGVIEVRLNAPEGTGFDQLDRFTKQAEAKLMPLVGEGPVRAMSSRLPYSTSASEDFNAGSMTVFLRPWDERTKSSLDVTKMVNAKLGELTSVRGNATVRSSLGRGRGQPLNFVIAGATYPDLARARDRILAAVRDNPGLVNVDADYVESKPQLLIDVDTKRAGDLGVSVDDVSQALQTLMGSRRVSTYADNGKEYRVMVQAEAKGRDDQTRLAGVYVRSRAGGLIPLSNLVKMRDSSTARELGRFNKIRAITFQGGLAPGYSLGKALKFFEDEAAKSPEVLAVGYRGESQSLKQTGSSIWIVFGITIVIIYLLLAAQFESFVHPAVIITTVPLAVAGGIVGLALTHTTINLFSQIGIVMLVGLAAKNGILIVEFANQLRDEGMALHRAVVHAAVRRLRPILMTSIATVLGAVPLAMSHGAGAGARSAIGVVIVFGVSIATVITLFMIPLLYSLLARRTGSPLAVTRKLEAALADRPDHGTHHPAPAE
ncbi:efflux RND transporter permease subunit [Sphingomonas sp. BIUV-7]|uniref:Efflux RND transporter permease subunit n=1 Tax=Sphingomonas natans TaxID=3063330 RepID=A0ABT8Y8Y4_9SPHN|nr:efflux RND transporter permease subunit [Sphingomonas sp. BIUV-7]MDO6414791.1 efflux RND transporter permease subunit [Sphingomonas sp. BIUV-7]